MDEVRGNGMNGASRPAASRTLAGLPRPLTRQAVLLVAVLLDLAVLLVWGEPSAVGPFYLAGLLLLLVTTGGSALARPGSRWAPVADIAPLVDLAAIGLMCLVPGGNGLAVLAVLPAMWLGADRRVRGAGIAMVATLVLVSLPALAYFGVTSPTVSRGLLIPVLAGLCSLTVAGTGQVWVRQNRELQQQGQRLEDALEEVTANRALNEAIIAHVDVGLLALDKVGAYRVVNPRQAEFLDLAYPDGHHGTFGQVGAVFGADRVTPLAQADLPTSRAMTGETFTGEVIWVGDEPSEQRALSVSAGPVLDSSGSFDGAVLAYMDITDLMSALKVKDDFVASVSHELRTPLTSIMGFLDLVLDEEDAVSEQVRQQLDIVKRNSERLLRLVGDLLLTAQVDEGSLCLHLRSVDMSAVVEHAVADLALEADDRGIALDLEIEPGVTVQGDATRLRQLVDNLVSNAIKYTPRGGTVTVGVRGCPESVVLEVADTGIGISRRDLGQVFTRFFRAEEAESRAIQGIGLGLAISKAIVEAHGGTVRVDSEVGRGSSFRVELPARGPRARGLSGGAPSATSSAWRRA